MNKKQIREIEEDFNSLFTKKIQISKNLYRYVDDDVFDMYDHNYFVYNNNTSIKEIYDGQAYQYQRGDNFYKLCAHRPLHKIIIKMMELEENMILTMVHDQKTNRFTINEKIEIHEASLKEFEEIEIKHYQKLYGKAFIKRRDKAYFKEVKRNKEFKIIGAYLNGKLVGSCYAYFHKGYVMIDDLLVDRYHRKKHIASTILKYFYDSGYRMMLHADYDDYQRHIYADYGFEVVDITYEYFKKLCVIGDEIKIVMDRPLGTRHPDKPEIYYELNYGYVKNILSPDGEGQDAYVMDVKIPLKTYKGKLIAIAHRTDDLEDKWILSHKNHSDKEIEKAIHFQEKYHKHYLIRKK